MRLTKEREENAVAAGSGPKRATTSCPGPSASDIRDDAHQAARLTPPLTDPRPHGGAGLVLVLLALLAGCRAIRGFDEPVPIERVGFLQRSITDSEGGLSVTVAVPSSAETEQLFGTSLYAARIQPLWVEVENDEDVAFVLLKTGIDPNNYSPHEVAYARRTLSNDVNHAMIEHIESLAFDGPILPGTTVNGFVFTQIDEGRKAVHIDLLGDRRLRSFSFVVPVPGLVTDVARVDFANLYSEYLEIESEQELRDALHDLPRCTTNKNGRHEGDPLNLVLIGEPDHVLSAVIRRDWHQTEVTYFRSALKTIRSFLFGRQYLYSPISPLYVFGRSQDIGLQKARSSISQRNHMRFWRTPINYRGAPVYLGQISRDIGVKFTTKTLTLTTHAVDPAVDDTRDELASDLAYSQSMTRFGYVGGAPVSTRENPRRNLTGDPYYSDGLRAVMFFDGRATSLVDIELLDWDLPANLRSVLVD